jgi:hypothetical protein
MSTWTTGLQRYGGLRGRLQEMAIGLVVLFGPVGAWTVDDQPPGMIYAWNSGAGRAADVDFAGVDGRAGAGQGEGMLSELAGGRMAMGCPVASIVQSSVPSDWTAWDCRSSMFARYHAIRTHVRLLAEACLTPAWRSRWAFYRPGS